MVHEAFGREGKRLRIRALSACAAAVALMLPALPAVAPDVEGIMTFHASVVTAARSIYQDHYEPAIAVSGTGAIYVNGHAPGADTTRSPSYVSTDDGATWRRLPDPVPVPLEGPGHGLGQGNEGVIAADRTGRAWLYDAAWIAGTAPLYGWCDDGARFCSFDPMAYDPVANAATPCGDPPPRFLDKPWAKFGHGKLLLANVGLRTAFVSEEDSSSELGLYDPETGAKVWNTCVGQGGLPGVPAIRDSDGMVAVPQVQPVDDVTSAMSVHSGLSLDAMRTVRGVFPASLSWLGCQLFNGYSDFSQAGTFYLGAALDPRTLVLAASGDLEHFGVTTIPAGGVIRYMWMSGSPRGEGALFTWAVGEQCDNNTGVPITFYAAHVALVDGRPSLTDVSVVAPDVRYTCGHYHGSALGPDGRAYLVVYSSPPGPVPGPCYNPSLGLPLKVYVQDGGPQV